MMGMPTASMGYSSGKHGLRLRHLPHQSQITPVPPNRPSDGEDEQAQTGSSHHIVDTEDIFGI